MLKFLFKTVQMLIIWIIIGVLGAYAYGYLKPHLDKTKPIIEQTVQKTTNKINQLKNNQSVSKIIKKTIEKMKFLKEKPIRTNKIAKKKIVEDKWPELLKAKVMVVDNSAKEHELFQRQMAIVNELMN